jgi:hypothetical protein
MPTTATLPAPVPPRLNKTQAAAYVPCSVRTLDRLPIPKIKVRGRVLYSRDSIDAYLKSLES